MEIVRDAALAALQQDYNQGIAYVEGLRSRCYASCDLLSSDFALRQICQSTICDTRCDVMKNALVVALAAHEVTVYVTYGVFIDICAFQRAHGIRACQARASTQCSNWSP